MKIQIPAWAMAVIYVFMDVLNAPTQLDFDFDEKRIRALLKKQVTHPLIRSAVSLRLEELLA